ncbi:hypothetical protein GCM10010302_59790 [Streptomyces polychromogenes]|uniref:Uncharacterized protein n=1 Tax=Streptomyces polychromogenes TaxID=67342 RepID=A0ABN0VNG1_9ACTN
MQYAPPVKRPLFGGGAPYRPGGICRFPASVRTEPPAAPRPAAAGAAPVEGVREAGGLSDPPRDGVRGVTGFAPSDSRTVSGGGVARCLRLAGISWCGPPGT